MQNAPEDPPTKTPTRMLTAIHENVHGSVLGQSSHVLLSHVLFLAQPRGFPEDLSKGFLQSEVLGKVCVLEEGSPGRSLGRSFWRSFRAWFDSEEQKLQPRSPTALHSKTAENSGENFMTGFCRDPPAKEDLGTPSDTHKMSPNFALWASKFFLPSGQWRLAW